MFGNRTLEMKMIKKSKETPEDSADHELTFEEKTKIVGRQLDRTFLRIGAIVFLFVTLDTVRQVMVANANKD